MFSLLLPPHVLQLPRKTLSALRSTYVPLSLFKGKVWPMLMAAFSHISVPVVMGLTLTSVLVLGARGVGSEPQGRLWESLLGPSAVGVSALSIIPANLPSTESLPRLFVLCPTLTGTVKLAPYRHALVSLICTIVCTTVHALPFLLCSPVGCHPPAACSTLLHHCASFHSTAKVLPQHEAPGCGGFRHQVICKQCAFNPVWLCSRDPAVPAHPCSRAGRLCRLNHFGANQPGSLKTLP